MSKKAIFAVLALTFLVHITYIPNGFTWLDHLDIEKSRGIMPVSQLYKTFITRYADTGFYRPMVSILHSLDYAVYRNFAPGYHFTNVLLHVGATAAVPGFLTAFFILKPWQLLLASLIFGVHPFSILPVGAISYRPELLLALFVFLTVHFYAKARLSTNLKNKLLFVICFFLAILSKETAVIILPSIILIWEYRYFKKIKLPSYKFIFGVILLLAVYFLLRFQAVPEVWRVTQTHLSLSETISTRLLAFGKLITQLIIPLKPSFSDATVVTSLTHPSSLAVLTVLAGIFLLMLKLGFRSQMSISIVLIATLLAPALNIVPLPRFSSPHYGYLAVGPFAAFLVLLLEKTQGLFRILCGLTLGIWIVLMSISSFQSGYQFKNDLTLFLPEVRIDPNFLEGHYYLGNYYLSKGNFKSAQTHYQSIISLPKNVIAFGDRFAFFLNLGNIAMLKGHFDKAQRFFKKTQIYASSPSQEMALAYNQAILAQSLYAAGKIDQAKQLIRDILPLLPADKKERVKKLLD